MDRAQLSVQLCGAYAAAVTPFNKHDDVDDKALAANIAWLLSSGLNGLLLLGSTGEQVHLSEFERALVLEVGRRAIPAERVLIAGTGLSGTRQTIEETRRAAEIGADAALVVTPSYYQKSMTAQALSDHYRAVADASPIPILLYSVPPITNLTLPPASVELLAGHPNIIGMKNSGHDVQLAAGYRAAAQPNQFRILGGSAYAAPGMLLAGLVDGVILAAGNILPEASVALVRAAAAQDIHAVQHWADLLRQGSETIGRFGIAGYKAGLDARGQVGGQARSPLRNLTADEHETIALAMHKLLAVPA